VPDDRRWGATGVTVCLSDRVVLDDVSFTVAPGQIVAVVGGDGAGKSTLLRTLIGRIQPFTGTVNVPPAHDIGYQPATSGTWGHLTVDENLDLVAGAYGLDVAASRERRDRLLAAAGLTDARSRLGDHLSGGMRQKLGFCMAMLHAPALVVLDEPSTGVDPVSRVELWGLITEAAADGAAVVLSTTYLDEAERVHDVLVLDDGQPLLAGAPTDVIAQAPGTVASVAQPSDPERAWRRGRSWRQWHAGPPTTDDVVVRPDMEDAVVAAALARRPVTEVPPVLRVGSPTRTPSERPLAEVDRASRTFGADIAVDDATMQVSSGEIVGLIGANGAGKTTLIRLQLGLLLPSSGYATLFGEAPSRQTRRRLGYVPQSLGLYRDLTVGENLAFVTGAYDQPAALPDELESLTDDLVGSIGLGRQRQLAFTCALSHSPELLVLDEPTSGVDPISRARLWDTIHAEAEAGIGVLVSTHYMQEAEQCDRLVLMDLGRIVAQGSVSDILEGATAVQVDAGDWGRAFAALTEHGLAVSLSGVRVRVVDSDEATVRDVLATTGLDVQLEIVPATLEERMTSIARNRAGTAS
jgi:ABC-2 type transport system ATP-binding protein